MKMRIISGDFKGRYIKVPRSNKIRPTTDRVRETLFNILTNKYDFNDLTVLDIYAGSGSLGLECLSRGASTIHFIEQDYIIYKNLIQNIKSLGVEERTKVFKSTAVKFTSSKPKQKYDLILADPPFFKYDIYRVLDNLLNNEYLTQFGSILIERSIQTKTKDAEIFNTEPFKIIGDTCLYEIIT